MKLLASSVLPDTAFFQGAKTSPVCASDYGSIKVKMSIEHWWSDTDRGKQKYWEKNLCRCLFIHHKSDVDWPAMEHGTPQPEAARSRLSHRMAVGLKVV